MSVFDSNTPLKPLNQLVTKLEIFCCIFKLWLINVLLIYLCISYETPKWLMNKYKNSKKRLKWTNNFYRSTYFKICFQCYNSWLEKQNNVINVQNIFLQRKQLILKELLLLSHVPPTCSVSLNFIIAQYITHGQITQK